MIIISLKTLGLKILLVMSHRNPSDGFFKVIQITPGYKPLNGLNLALIQGQP